MTLAELADTLEVPARQIRFMIAEGIMPAALKTGRAADAYGEEHLRTARRYLTLHRLGMKPAAIKVLFAFDEAIPIYKSGGIELRVDPALDPLQIDLENILKDLGAALESVASKNNQK
jgi:hypothetical protein